MKTILKMSAIAAAVMASTPVLAGAADWNCWEKDGAEFQGCAYVGAGLGYSHLDPDHSDTGWEESNRGNLAGLAFAGYHFAPHWFAELAYADLGDVDVENRNPLVNAKGSIDYQAPSIMAGYYLDLGLPVDPFIKVGVSAIQNSTSSSKIDYEKEHNAQLALGAGIDWRFAKHWKMRTALESYDEDALLGYVGVAYIFGEGKAKPAPAPEPAPAPAPAPAPQPEPEPVVEAAPPAPVVTQELCEVFDGTLEGVHFKTASAELTDSAKVTLAKTAKVLKQFPAVKLEVQAHTDSQGSDAYNQKLSDSRAKSVMDYFITQGVDAARMTSKGYGESQPVADNATVDGRALNRRVELVSHIEQCKQQ